jgi:hypothetical protein
LFLSLDKKAYPMSAFVGTLNQSPIRRAGSFRTILASAWAGLLLASTVYTLGPPRLPSDSDPPMTFSAPSEFEAVSLIEDGANAVTAPSEPLARNVEQAAPLFGMQTEPVAAGELPQKWHTSRPRWLEISRWLRNAVPAGPAQSPRKD